MKNKYYILLIIGLFLLISIDVIYSNLNSFEYTFKNLFFFTLLYFVISCILVLIVKLLKKEKIKPINHNGIMFNLFMGIPISFLIGFLINSSDFSQKEFIKASIKIQLILIICLFFVGIIAEFKSKKASN